MQLLCIAYKTLHYYPFGLSMSGISSKAAQFGQPANKKKYNGYELTTDFDLNLHKSFYRSHDPQLGRFWQLDPKPADNISLYSAMSNNPIGFSDPLGDTIRMSFRTGFFGIFGKKQTVDYQDGKLYDTKSGAEYTGKLSKFASNTFSDLKELSANHVSQPVVKELQDYNQVIKLQSGGSTNVDWISYINNNSGSIPQNYNRGQTLPNDLFVGGKKDNAPASVKLFHEFAHILQFKQLYGDRSGYLTSTNTSAFFGLWFMSGSDRIVNSEKFATHYENMLRASLPNVPLREIYSRENITPEPGRLLNRGTRASIFYPPYVYQ